MKKFKYLEFKWGLNVTGFDTRLHIFGENIYPNSFEPDYNQQLWNTKENKCSLNKDIYFHDFHMIFIFLYQRLKRISLVKYLL